MTAKSLLILLPCALVSMGLSVPWQEQPQDKNKSISSQSQGVTPGSQSGVSSIEDSKDTNLTEQLKKLSSASFVDSSQDQDVKSIPKLPSQSGATSAANQVNRLNKLQRLARINMNTISAAQNASRIPNPRKLNQAANPVPKSGGNASIIELPRLQGQINNITKLGSQLEKINKNQVTQLQKVVNLSQTHERILEELKKAEAEGTEVSVSDEDEILRQQEIRLKRQAS